MNGEKSSGKVISEIWKPIKGYEGHYEISNLGRVRSLDRHIAQKTKGGVWVIKTYKGRILKPGADKDGYFQVSLCKCGKPIQRKVHRLVAEAFIAKVPGKDIINHIDSNKQNNNYTNLEWCTTSENIKHSYRHGHRMPLHPKGVIQYDKNGNFIKKWKSIKEACRNTGAYPASLSRACKQNGTSGGYKWRYIE